ncbi:MAG: alanine racemase [Verrucomicrobia bacterium]|nr:MAG: alanine racemase [Verrucomicrobiota bacterium]
MKPHFPRTAWISVDLARLAANFRRIRAELAPGVRLLHVVKDNAYGQGAPTAARVALANGASDLAVYTLGEAAALRDAGLRAPILVLGEREPAELPACRDLDLVPTVGNAAIAAEYDRIAAAAGRRLPVHLKINTGMNRFGFPWREASRWVADLARLRHLEFAGAFGHFAQSDEIDKTFARAQLANFRGAIETLRAGGIEPACLHHANSGGFLDLPEAHLGMVRLGILPLGVYPSQVCRCLAGLETVLSLRARIVALQTVEPGDSVGYGMRWTASRPGRIGVLPLGYGDGFPRVRNEGHVLLHGRRVPIVGGVTMDALMVDLTDLPGAGIGDEAVLMGEQGGQEITVHEIAALKGSVSYDVLVGLRSRLPREYIAAA